MIKYAVIVNVSDGSLDQGIRVNAEVFSVVNLFYRNAVSTNTELVMTFDLL